jgi:hypothetical protein
MFGLFHVAKKLREMGNASCIGFPEFDTFCDLKGSVHVDVILAGNATRKRGNIGVEFISYLMSPPSQRLPFDVNQKELTRGEAKNKPTTADRGRL